MTESGDITALSADLEQRLGDKLGLRRGSLSARARKAGRRLPRAVRRDAELIGQAGLLAAHPKLRKRVDAPAVAAAHRRVAEHLDGIDRGERRMNLLLGLLAGLVANLILLALLTVAVLKWRGLI
ncbi:MAG: hypothetical protein R3D85_02395 [Paracoccaceae bacterium]